MWAYVQPCGNPPEPAQDRTQPVFAFTGMFPSVYSECGVKIPGNPLRIPEFKQGVLSISEAALP